MAIYNVEELSSEAFRKLIPQAKLFNDSEGRDGEQIQLTGTNMTHLDLSGLHLSGMDLSGKNLNGMNLDDTHFKECDLTGTSFNGASLNHTGFYMSALDNADLKQTTGIKPDFQFASLTDASFNGSHLESPQFSYAYGLHVKMVNAAMNGINGYKMRLLDSDFSKGYFKYGSFTETDINQSKCEGATFDYANFSRANLNGCNFDNATMAYTNLTSAKMGDVKTNGLYMPGLITTDIKTDLTIAKFDQIGKTKGSIVYNAIHDQVSMPKINKSISMAEFEKLALKDPVLKNVPQVFQQVKKECSKQTVR